MFYAESNFGILVTSIRISFTVAAYLYWKDGNANYIRQKFKEKLDLIKSMYNTVQFCTLM